MEMPKPTTLDEICNSYGDDEKALREKLEENWSTVFEHLVQSVQRQTAVSVVQQLQQRDLIDFASKRIVNTVQEILDSEEKTDNITDGIILLLLCVCLDGSTITAQATLQLLQALAPSVGAKLLTTNSPIVIGIMEYTVPKMHLLFDDHEPKMALQLLNCCVTMFGSPLIRHLELLNMFMSLAERSFQHTDEDITQMAFRVWANLIELFSNAEKTYATLQHLRVLLKPLLYVRCTSDASALSKLTAWWTLCKRLGRHLKTCFTPVCVPMIHFCAGGSLKVTTESRLFTADYREKNVKTKDTLTFVAEEVNCDFGPKSLPEIDSVRSLIAELGAKLLLNNAQSVLPSCQLSPLSTTPLDKDETLDKYANFIVDFLCCSVNVKEITEAFEPALSLCFGKILQLTLKSCPNDQSSTRVDWTLVKISEMLLNSHWTLEHCLIMFCSIFDTLQKHHSVGSTCEWRQFWRSKICQYLKEHLTLIGQNGGVFFQTRLETFYKNARNTCLHCCSRAEVVKFWQESTTTLVAYLQETNEIDDANGILCRPQCAYTLLCDIFLHSQHLKSVADAKSVVDVWEKLYKECARCVSLLANFSVNEFLAQLFHRLQPVLEEVQSKQNVRGVYCIIKTLEVIEEQAPMTNQDIATLSPRSAENFSAFERVPNAVVILLQFLSCAVDAYRKIEGHELGEFDTNLVIDALSVVQLALNRARNPCDLVCTLQLSSSTIANLVELTTCSHATVWRGKISQIVIAIEAMLKRIVDMHFGPYDSSLLKCLAPLLKTVLNHPKRSVRQTGCNFWQKTFATTTSMHYPKELEPILEKLSKSGHISTPGLQMQRSAQMMADSMDSVSNFSHSNSLSADAQPCIVGQPSPEKMFGSLLRSTQTLRQITPPLESKQLEPMQFGSVRKRLELGSPIKGKVLKSREN